jgi:two-component system, NtrC family, sensor histidine kinase AtoS
LVPAQAIILDDRALAALQTVAIPFDAELNALRPGEIGALRIAPNTNMLNQMLPFFVNRAQAITFDRAMKAARRGEVTNLGRISMKGTASNETVWEVVVAPQAKGGVCLWRAIPDPLFASDNFKRILDRSPDGIFVIDTDRRVRLFNKACGEITGRAPEEIVGAATECSEVIKCHAEDGQSYATNLCPAKSVFRGEETAQREEMLLTNSSGEERWIETSYSPVLDSHGKVEFVVGILRDIHDRKLLAERLHQTEKLASLGQLVAGIAHEIKNPLAIIQSSLDVLENNTRPAEQRREASQFMREEIHRLDTRLRAFLDFARPREMAARPVLLSGLIARRSAALGQLFPLITFRTESLVPEPILMADEEQLGQVLTNLVVNAAEAMEGRGQVWMRLRQGQDHIILEVEDDGPGVPEDLQTRVFDPFFTTKPTGTGLGLSICYQIVLAHGGTISIGKGRNGRGTVFGLRLRSANRFSEQPTAAANSSEDA